MIAKRLAILWMTAAVSCIALTGCEWSSGGGSDNDSSGNTQAPANAAPEPQASAPPADFAPSVGSADDLDISGARQLGPHANLSAAHAAVTRLLYSANVSGGSVELSFDTLHWPAKRGKKTVDGAVYIFWVSGGQVIGGYFDAHAVGQTRKGLENIHGGYLNGRKPGKGDTVYFALVSLDGRQRTNVKRSNTTW